MTALWLKQEWHASCVPLKRFQNTAVTQQTWLTTCEGNTANFWRSNQSLHLRMRKLPWSSKLLIQVHRFFRRYFQPSCHTAQAEQKQFGAFISNISFYLNEILIVTLKYLLQWCFNYRNTIAIVKMDAIVTPTHHPSWCTSVKNRKSRGKLLSCLLSLRSRKVMYSRNACSV